MYHDLDLRFTSPTINLFFDEEDYFELLSHLEHYLQSVPTEITLEGIDYPVGVLRRGSRQITVHFMHYRSFENARVKWVERAKRADLDNLYIVFEHPTPCEDDDPWLHRFLSLPFEHKLMFTDCRKLRHSYDHVVHMPVYERTFSPGEIIKRKNPLTCQRYLDDYDYVSFLSE